MYEVEVKDSERVNKYKNLTFSDFQKIVLALAAKDTSAHPEEFKKEKSLLGHCTIVAILFQDIWGGDIMRACLDNVPGFESIKWHSWNRLADGTELDFIKIHLNKELPKNLPVRVVKREELFTYSGIEKRYQLFKSRFDDLLLEKNRLK